MPVGAVQPVRARGRSTTSARSTCGDARRTRDRWPARRRRTGIAARSVGVGKFVHRVHLRESNARSQAVSAYSADVAIEIDDLARRPALRDYRGIASAGKESDEYFIVEGLDRHRAPADVDAPRSVRACSTGVMTELVDVLSPVTIHAALVDDAAMSRGGGCQPAPRRAWRRRARPAPPALDRCSPSTRARLVMLEGINDHENLGAIARTARGLGADACCSTRPAPTRSTGAACASRWASCCTCRSFAAATVA